LRVTYGWPPIARLCYLELLSVQWDRGELPLEVEALHMLCPGVSAGEWGVAWSHIAKQFPVDDDGKNRRNYQLEMTRGESLRVAAVRSRAGKAAASARWNGRAPKEPPSSNQE
jgi:hypothetical protein